MTDILPTIDLIAEGQRNFAAGQYDMAATCAHHHILREKERHAEAYNLMGACFLETQRYQAALNVFMKAAVKLRDDPGFLSNLGAAYRELNKLDESRVCIHAALTKAPNEVLIRLNYVLTLNMLGLFDEVRDILIDTIRLDPYNCSAHIALGYNLLLRGETQAGWQEATPWFEKREFGTDVLPTDLPYMRWNGMKMPTKSLMVICDQGFGDCFQYARYIKAASERVKSLTLVAPPQIELLRHVSGVSKFTSEYADVPDDTVAYIRLSSLPSLGLAASSQPYIFAPDADIRMPDVPLKVGIAWRGGVNPRGRSMTIEQMGEALTHETPFFVSLQHGLTDVEEKWMCDHDIDFRRPINDFTDIAKLINAVDCVVTVDSAVAHLAGAMGKDTFLLLSKNNDWRWGMHDTAPNIYETVVTYRQSKAGDWRDPLARVLNDLEFLYLAVDRDAQPL